MVKASSKAKVGDNSPCAGPLIRYVIVGHRACGYNDLHSRSSLAVVRSHLVILHRTLGSQIPCSESHTNNSCGGGTENSLAWRSEEHTSELQSLMRISYAVFCLKKKKNNTQIN